PINFPSLTSAYRMGEFNQWKMSIPTSSEVDDACSEHVFQGLNDCHNRDVKRLSWSYIIDIGTPCLATISLSPWLFSPISTQGSQVATVSRMASDVQP
ncbi:hypothetical protein Tco_1078637, partial [Tanacetum coccineum]